MNTASINVEREDVLEVGPKSICTFTARVGVQGAAVGRVPGISADLGP